MTIASHLNFGAEKFGIASQDAVLTLEKSTIPQITAATYPAMIAIRIGITAKTYGIRFTKANKIFEGDIIVSPSRSSLALNPDLSLSLDVQLFERDH